MSTLHTRNGMLYLGDGAGTAAAIVSETTEFSVDVDFDTVDDSAMGDTWETKLKGSLRWNGAFSGNFDDASTLLFDAATGYTAPEIYLYMDRSSSTRYYYGSCWPKLSITASRTDAGKVSGTFEGTGQLYARTS